MVDTDSSASNDRFQIIAQRVRDRSELTQLWLNHGDRILATKD